MDTSLDGNAAAGTLGDLFAFDVTMAVIDVRHLSATPAASPSCAPTWTPPASCCAAHPVVPRSSASSAPGDRAWLDLQGIQVLEIHSPTAAD